MARIRNIKPEIFRHEILQDLEAAHPGAYIILTYIALWTQCDANGNFQWRPRTLKLDILPFIPFNLENTLQVLEGAKFIIQYNAHDGNTYGHVIGFTKHQRITGKEATEGQKYPMCNPGNTRETPGKHPDAQGEGEERNTGKEYRERERENAHAHESSQKEKQNPDNPPHPAIPSTGGAEPQPDPYTHCITEIRRWAKQTGDWSTLSQYAQSVGYDPATYGPVNDEVQKFTAYWLDPSRHPNDRATFITNPADFFQQKGRKWLLDAKTMNKKPKQPPKPRYEPPLHQTRRTNATPTSMPHIGDILQNIIT